MIGNVKPFVLDKSEKEIVYRLIVGTGDEKALKILKKIERLYIPYHGLLSVFCTFSTGIGAYKYISDEDYNYLNSKLKDASKSRMEKADIVVNKGRYYLCDDDKAKEDFKCGLDITSLYRIYFSLSFETYVEYSLCRKLELRNKRKTFCTSSTLRDNNTSCMIDTSYNLAKKSTLADLYMFNVMDGFSIRGNGNYKSLGRMLEFKDDDRALGIFYKYYDKFIKSENLSSLCYHILSLVVIFCAVYYKGDIIIILQAILGSVIGYFTLILVRFNFPFVGKHSVSDEEVDYINSVIRDIDYVCEHKLINEHCSYYYDICSIFDITRISEDIDTSKLHRYTVGNYRINNKLEVELDCGYYLVLDE